MTMTTPDLIARREAVDGVLRNLFPEWEADQRQAIAEECAKAALEASDADTVRVPRAELERIASCKIIATQHPEHGPVICWDFDVNEAARKLLTASHPKPEPCPSCGGLNTSCPEGCGRDPATGELDGTTLKPEPVETQPATYADFQQRRGRLPDLIEEALSIYDEFMKDDAYDAQRPLDKIAETLRAARDFYDVETQPEASRSPVSEERAFRAGHAAAEETLGAHGSEWLLEALEASWAAYVADNALTPSPRSQAPSEERANALFEEVAGVTDTTTRARCIEMMLRFA